VRGQSEYLAGRGDDDEDCGADEDDPGQAEQEQGLGKRAHVPVEIKSIGIDKI
jgi:hypothetical protein